MNKTNSKDAGKINPEDIKFTENAPSDADMPKPETRSYDKPSTSAEEKKKVATELRLTPKFTELFNSCVCTLPYGTVLTAPNGDSIKLIDFVRFIEEHTNCMKVVEMNTIIAYMQSLPFNAIRPILEIIENGQKSQSELWTLITDK